jgi:hypothetical protein
MIRSRTFDQFENAKSSTEKQRIISNAVTKLKMHALIEEEIFYPTVRKHVGTDFMNEATKSITSRRLSSPNSTLTGGAVSIERPILLSLRKVCGTTSRKKKMRCRLRQRSST